MKIDTLPEQSVYCVLSIKQIRKMLKLAQQGSRASYGGKINSAHCIVINAKLNNYVADDGARQISTPSFSYSGIN